MASIYPERILTNAARAIFHLTFLTWLVISLKRFSGPTFFKSRNRYFGSHLASALRNLLKIPQSDSDRVIAIIDVIYWMEKILSLHLSST